MTAAPQPGRDDEHVAWDELAVGWALHALEPEDESLFAAHLRTCDRCRQTVADTAEVMAALAGDLPQAEPSDGLRDRLRAAVAETEQVRPVELPEAPASRAPVVRPPLVPSPPLGGASPYGNLRAPLPPRRIDARPSWRRVLPTALVAAAVAAVLALGAWNVVVTGDRDAARSTAEEQGRVLDSLLQPGRAAIAPLTENGSRIATVVARDGQVQVLADGLPVNDASNQVYVVWGMRNGTPVAIGTFDVVTPQMDVRTVGSAATGLDDYSAYALSIEPGRQAPTTPSEIVATGQVTS
jgi:hypothetical protein